MGALSTGFAYRVCSIQRTETAAGEETAVNLQVMVSREGFEPSTRGLRVHCSATELPARRQCIARRPRLSRRTLANPLVTTRQ